MTEQEHTELINNLVAARANNPEATHWMLSELEYARLIRIRDGTGVHLVNIDHDTLLGLPIMICQVSIADHDIALGK